MVLFLLRLLLGGVFVVSSWGKLRYPRVFAESLVAYELLPESLVTLVALTIPWLELLAGLALMIGFRARAGALVLGGLSTMFLLVVSSVLWRGLDVSCGCFVGVEWAKVNWGHMLLDLCLMGIALAIYLKGPGKFAADKDMT